MYEIQYYPDRHGRVIANPTPEQRQRYLLFLSITGRGGQVPENEWTTLVQNHAAVHEWQIYSHAWLYAKIVDGDGRD